MRKLSPNIIQSIDPDYTLLDAVVILRRYSSPKLNEVRRVPSNVVDHFLLSGRFNSVLGLEGFRIFKEKLKDVISKVNENDFGSNYINLDVMFEALLDSGVYYLNDYLPEEIVYLKSDERWLTAYRYIAANFPEIPYKDFRKIVTRFEESRGYAFYIEPNDSEFLRQITSNSNLFKEIVDIKAALLQLRWNELKSICDLFAVRAARSLADTADRIIEAGGDKVIQYLPKKTHERRSLIICDQELASGDDIIRLDKYLRVLAKLVRSDFVQFVTDRRTFSIYNKPKGW